jgi:ribosomal protein S6--L-glutamate ligase
MNDWMDDTRIALAPFLRSCPSVITLGILPAFDDYSPEARRLLRRAHRVFFPTPRYAGLFQAVGIPTFPLATTYRYQRSNILQTNLFQCLKWPHPRTRIYFGMRQKQNIPKDFVFPFWGMGRRVSATQSHSIADLETLERLSHLYNPLIIQEKIRWMDRIELICVQFECVAALRRKTDDADRGAFGPIPPSHSSPKGIIEATHRLLRLAQLDDISVEWGYGQHQWQVIGLKRPPLRWNTPQGTVHRHQLICQLIQNGRL